MDYKKIISEHIRIQGVTADEIYSLITVPPDLKNGQFCLPCFKFARTMRLSPQAIAQKLSDEFPSFDWLTGTQAVAGYLNFMCDRSFMAKETVEGVLGKGDGFAPYASNGKTVCIDYSSINIAKPFHIGHLLTTVIGGSLYRIFRFLGYKTVGINHLGDWGTQFGKLIVAYKKWGSADDIEKRGILSLLDLYVRFHSEAENNPALEDEGRYWFKKIEDGDDEALNIFNRFKDITLKEVNKVYKRLGIEFDSYAGESFYNDKLAPVVDELRQKGLLTLSDGAQVVDLSDDNMPPCLILKKDGASLYATRDLAAAEYRYNTYNFYKCLYVVAYQQNLHFKQLFRVLEKMGKPYAKDMVHVAFGMVSLEGGESLSTRKGNVVFLTDVIEKSVKKAGEVIRQKSPDLDDKDVVAEQVGVGAVIFSALSTSRIKDMVFSYDRALAFDGETAPYVQYTHARCCSALCKSSAEGDIDYADLTDDESFAVVMQLSMFDRVVADAAARYEPSLIARYLVDLCQAYNRFYIDHRVADNASRICLTRAVKNVLKNGLELILIKAPERM